MQIQKHHFFGDYEIDEQSAKLKLSDVERLAAIADPHHLKAHAQQLFDAHPAGIVLYDHTSHPSLTNLLDALCKVDSISLVRLQATRRPNGEPSITCQLVGPNGAWLIAAHWASNQPLRTAELVSSLLRPLLAHGLAMRTILSDESEGSSFDVMPGDTVQQILAVISLFGTPYSLDRHGPMDDLVKLTSQI